MDKCGSFILWHLTQLCKDRGMAEDLSQKLWVYVYRRFEVEDFEHVGFLKRKASQLYIDQMRRLDSRPALSYVEQLPDPVAKPSNAQPLNDSEEKALSRNFWERFSELNLPEQPKQIFWLHARYGYTMKEIGQQLGIGASTAHDHLNHVKALCYQHLTKDRSHVS